jgi:hypothetical protein
MQPAAAGPTFACRVELAQLRTYAAPSNFPTEMNPRRVHELMRAHFATTDAATAEWTNLVDEHGLLMEDRAQVVLLEQFIEKGVEEVLVEVQRKVGDQLRIDQVVPYLRTRVGRGNVRIANREFTVFAEVAINGVGRSWQTSQ